MYLQRIINESSTKQQGNISDSEVNTTKIIKITKVSIEIINVSKCLFKGSSTNNRRSNKETSMFLRLKQNKFLSLMFASKSSKSYQRFFCIGSSTINQSSSKGISTFYWLSQYKLQWSLAFASKCSECHQIFLKESSTNHHWRSNQTSMIQSLTKQKQ